MKYKYKFIQHKHFVLSKGQFFSLSIHEISKLFSTFEYVDG